jgi:NAD(P)-dependent dehydrogenase (short-subunit alcohol dehydrogenase family)
MAAYVASKAAVVGLTRAMALDHAAQQVRVNCVCPGLVDTPLAASAQERRPDATRSAVAGFDDYLIKRQASAEEVAAYICFLGSPEAGYITGSTVAVDGGRTLH